MNVSRELAQRRQDGFEVTLLWNACSNEVSVGLVDEGARCSFAFVVDPSRALDAFHHPFAYAAVVGAELRPDPELAAAAEER
jgi:hypothetical protein